MDIDILDNIYESSLNNHHVYGMGQTTVEDIIDYTQYQIEDIIYKQDLNNIEIVELELCGSRINENPHKDSDLDIVLYYKGNIPKENLYNILHKDEYIDQLTYQKIYIDIKPELVK